MIPLDHEAWRRAMGEAASLPPDDPDRVEMQGEVARLGPWAEKEWLALLEEGERWRLELARVEPPEGLEARLLRIPGGRAAPPLWFARRWLGWGVAAVLLLAIGVFALLRSRPTDDPVSALALLAVNDHLDTHGLDVETSDPDALARRLGEVIPFDVRFPAFTGSPRLEGGRKCTLCSHPVAFSTWRRGDVRFTLLQLRRSDFGLPAGLPPTVVSPKGAAASRRPLDVLLWTEGEFGWALVADEPSALRDVRPVGR